MTAKKNNETPAADQNDQPTPEAAAAETTTPKANKYGITREDGESAEDYRRRYSRTVQKIRYADPSFAARRKASSLASHARHRASDPAVLAKKSARLRALAAELGYDLVAKVTEAE